MNMSHSEKGTVCYTEVEVCLWKDVGLALHKDEENKQYWRISHFNSGCYILRRIPTLEEAIRLMIKLHKDILWDWNFSKEMLIERKEWETVEDKVFSLRKALV